MTMAMHFAVPDKLQSFSMPSSSESPLEDRLLNMNLQALNLLFEGHEDHAKALMVWCLSLIQAHMKEAHRSSVTTSSSSSPPPVTFAALEMMEGVLEEPSQVEGLTKHNSFLLYRRVFTLEFDDRNGNGDQTKDGSALLVRDWDLASIAALFLYNLALVHHESGINIGFLPSLQQACNLYESALTLLQPPHSALSSVPHAHLHLLMALYNNLGNAATYLRNGGVVDHCLNALEKLLIGPAHSSAGDAQDTSHPDDNMILCTQFFRSSLTRACVHTTGVSP